MGGKFMMDMKKTIDIERLNIELANNISIIIGITVLALICIFLLLNKSGPFSLIRKICTLTTCMVFAYSLIVLIFRGYGLLFSLGLILSIYLGGILCMKDEIKEKVHVWRENVRGNALLNKANKKLLPLISSSFYEKTLTNRLFHFNTGINRLNEEVFPEEIQELWLTLDEKYAYYQNKMQILKKLEINEGIFSEIGKWRTQYKDILEYNENYCVPILDQWSKYGINIIGIHDQLSKDYETYNNLYHEIIVDMKGTIAGIKGEERVNEALSLFDDNICNLQNIRFVLNGKSAESDNIVITNNGIFAIEVKNFGEGSDYTIKVSKDGKWTREYPNGYIYDMQNVTSQAMMHVGINQKLINSEMKSRIGEEVPFFPVNPIVVIANDDVYIENESEFPLMRVSNIYYYMTQFKGTNLDKKYWGPIKEIIEKNTLPPQKFPFMERFSVLQTAYQRLIDKTLALYALLSTVFTYNEDAARAGTFLNIDMWKDAYKTLDEYNNAMQKYTTFSDRNNRPEKAP